MEIIILGTGCTKCKSTYEIVKKVLSDNNISAVLKKEEDILEIMKYNILSLPAVVIDGKVALKGYVPTEEEVRKAVLSS
ncbi:MAG: thioredoxin family protein [Tissierellia bacterium]|nr:thioredoxin family protein [Tissierellia bacterium]